MAIGGGTASSFIPDFPTLNSSSRLLKLDEEVLTGFRLPTNTIPISYSLELKTKVHDNGDSAFSGSVVLFFKVLEVSQIVTLHCKNLKILKVDMVSATSKIYEENLSYNLDESSELLKITAPAELELNNYRYKIQFEGTINDDFGGFFRTFYKDANGKSVWLAATQLEFTDARRVFPCYDEPQIRAIYDISIEHHKDYFAISNSPQISTTALAGTDYVTTKFASTPNIQSYLVAFVVSNLKYIENLAAVPPQRVFATPAQIDNGEADFALDFGEKVLKKLEEYLNVKYLMPKMDQVAIPNVPNLKNLFPDTPDMPFAMENYALVTYQDEGVLYNSKVASFDKQLTVVKTIGKIQIKLFTRKQLYFLQLYLKTNNQTI